MQQPPTPAATLRVAVGGEDALATPQSRAERVAAAFLVAQRPATRAAYWRSLRAWARWCAEHDVEVLAAERAHVAPASRTLDQPQTGSLKLLCGTPESGPAGRSRG